MCRLVTGIWIPCSGVQIVSNRQGDGEITELGMEKGHDKKNASGNLLK